ncbi:hypothetical protein SEPCBS119000_001457 [Sporothrix epigloea]|uniref:Impact N-terminal domain-containing protein n=1 Tax=Sporothrix epigloea TaxID=1892477 RepID=A0ABP0DDU1_9PEZI
MAAAPSENDLQELLRLLTTTRKLSMLQAMAQVKALQAVSLRSIKQIAEAPLDTVQTALRDPAGAKSLQTSCKTAVKRMAAGAGASGVKRRAATVASSQTASSAKRAKQLDGTAAANSAVGLPGLGSMTAAEVERSLELPVFVPVIDEDEERMAATALLTNRAPLVLAFAVELLRYTMPEQPISSRLSLGQAVVSANSRSKATSLGLDWARGPSADEAGWGQGQPRVRILGREVAVLKRSGYTWKGDEEEETEKTQESAQRDGQVKSSEHSSVLPETVRNVKETESSEATPASQEGSLSNHLPQHPPAGVWSMSQTISLKGSSFVARATTITEAGQRAGLIRSLMEAQPGLLTATHNAWAYRVRGTGDYSHNVRQDSYDDGETGCGDLMLRVLQELGAVDTLVVLTRWFGGTMLGPDRWRLMRNCVTGAMAERLHRKGDSVGLGGEAVWGLDLEAMRQQHAANAGDARSASARFKHGSGAAGPTAVVGMPIHRPEGAKHYLLRSFASAEEAVPAGDENTAQPLTPTKKKKTTKAMDLEKEENLSLLLGALRVVFDSWADHLPAAELDRRAWGWYVAVRPDVDSGPSGWGAKGVVKLKDILAFRRKET